MRLLRTLGLGAAALTAGGLALVGWAVGIERRRFTLREAELPILPPGASPLKVLHLADFHFVPGQRKKQRFVQALAQLAPDLIIDTGDNLGHREALAGLREMLEPFRGIPALSVFGSNDYYGPVLKNPFVYLRKQRKQGNTRPRDLDEAGLRALLFDDFGWTDLTNTAAIVRVGELRIRAIGVDDPHIRADRPDAAFEQAARLDAGWDLTLGVVHAPYQRILNRFVAEGKVDALFAGHTHGGQVCLPGQRAIVSNCDLPPRQAGGLTTWESGGRTVPLHVSRGLGTSMFAPVRTFCPPEATLVTLVARTAESASPQP